MLLWDCLTSLSSDYTTDFKRGLTGRGFVALLHTIMQIWYYMDTLYMIVHIWPWHRCQIVGLLNCSQDNKLMWHFASCILLSSWKTEWLFQQICKIAMPYNRNLWWCKISQKCLQTLQKKFFSSQNECMHLTTPLPVDSQMYHPTPPKVCSLHTNFRQYTVWFKPQNLFHLYKQKCKYQYGLGCRIWHSSMCMHAYLSHIFNARSYTPGHIGIVPHQEAAPPAEQKQGFYFFCLLTSAKGHFFTFNAVFFFFATPFTSLRRWRTCMNVLAVKGAMCTNAGTV